MPKIEQWIIDKVKDEADIVDVVGDILGTYGPDNTSGLRKAGVNYTAICPFHEDHNSGNFIVRPKGLKNGGNTYHCFVCMKHGEGGGPVDFVMKHEHLSFADAIRWLGKKYCIEVDNVPLNYTPPPRKPTPPPPPDMVMERDLVKQTMAMANDQNLFCYWLSRLPWSDAQRNRLPQTMWQYCVGGWRDGRVCFWKIDHMGIPRSAKLMTYQPNGKRDKTKNPGWLYNQDGVRQKCKPDEHTILKPLFGIHLLKRYPQAIVNIVESEKTAIIMANFYGNPDKQLWLACGGLQWLQLESMQPLIDQGRTVWLWPDKDGVSDWQKLVDKLGSEKVNIYTKFFDTCWREEDGPTADCADIILRMMTKPENIDEPPVKNDSKNKDMGLVEWPNDDPFIDPIELMDERVHMWREILRRRYNFNKSKDQ